MDQIKIFTNFDVTSLETDVNDWLKQNKGKIKHINSHMVTKGSHAGSVSDMMEWMVVVHYEAVSDE